MMNKDNLNTIFENLRNEFDVEHPNDGHQDRFLNKLTGQQTKVVVLKTSQKNYWKPFIAVAASLVLCFSLITVLQQQPEAKDLASISPELSNTQDFFNTTIATELAALNNERTPETEAIINDALKQIKHLEKAYESLKVDLTKSGDDKRVIYAMISNFQSRIDLLNNVLIQIEEVKQLNQNNDEHKITI
ncbi:hypothetical protein ACFO5O_05990 [Geojedonia litorea]|uniref:DUF4179 domain-containing protein n=1 Tax=Geojedonia litorea TaxID=1268269 RepID=A0ABV9N2P6_9FLAO